MDTMNCAQPVQGDWRAGKTVESIEFVRCAEECIEKLKDDAILVAKLRKLVDRIKCGDVVVTGPRLPLPPLHDFFGD